MNSLELQVLTTRSDQQAPQDEAEAEPETAPIASEAIPPEPLVRIELAQVRDEESTLAHH